MTKNILLVATALLALGATPVLAETAKMAPSPVTKSSTAKKVHAKKIHHVNAVHHGKMPKATKTSLSVREKAITRDLNKNGMQKT
jgi:hypothetical protein